jgi:hypothetical protein
MRPRRPATGFAPSWSALFSDMQRAPAAVQGIAFDQNSVMTG